MRKQSKRGGSGAPPDLQGLAVFARVVEARSFSGAARALGTTTSAVSKRVARLEERLGVRLFARTTRRVELTEAGSTLYGHATRVLRELEDAEAAVAALEGAPRGTLRVSAPVILGERHLAPLVPGLLARFPELRIALSLSDRFVDLFAERYDVAVRVGTLASQDASLVGARAGATHPVVCASPAYFANRGTPETPADLVAHDCLRYSLVAASREWRFRRPDDGRELTVPVTGNLEVDHGGAIREAAIGGLGIAYLPDFLVNDALASGALVSALDAWRQAALPVNLVFARAPRTPPKVRAFVDWVRPRLRARLEAGGGAGKARTAGTAAG